MRNFVMGLAALAAVTATAPAAATTYAYSYTSTDLAAPFSAAGRFTVSGGFVTSITGNVDGDAISTLQSTTGLAVYSPTQFLSPDGAFYFNNAFTASDPVFDAGGVLFYSIGGFEYNLYGNGPGSYSILKNIPFGGRVSGSTGVMTLTAVPEAATWIMMIAGFGLVGVSARSRRTAVAA